MFGETTGQASAITIGKLSDELERLQEGKTEFDFFGITSNGIDCIYFVRDGENFQIEFEAMSENQVPYIEKLKEFASLNSLTTSMTTYGNKPHYFSDVDAPVIRLETNSDTEKTVEFARSIQNNLFGNGDATEYDIVP